MKKVTTVFYQHGQIYKEEFRPAEGKAFAVGTVAHSASHNQYFKTNRTDPENFCNWAGIKRQAGKVRVKRWRSTRQLHALMGMTGGVDLKGYDLAPQVWLWIAEGRYEDDGPERELYFHVHASWKLEAISLHYGLPDPITEAQKFDITQNPMNWRERILKPDNVTPMPVIVGSVAFEHDHPVRLKVYQFHHPEA